MVTFKMFIVIHLMIEEGQLDAMLHYILEKRTKSQSVNSQKVSDIYIGKDWTSRQSLCPRCFATQTHKVYRKLAALALIRRFTRFLSCSVGLVISVIT